MAEKTKSTGKPITDIAHPNKSAPAQNSKSVIVTNRPMLKDPMVVDDTTKAEKPAEIETLATASSKTPPTGDDNKPTETEIKPSNNTITEIAAIAAADKSDKAVKDDKPEPEPEADKPEAEAPKTKDVSPAADKSDEAKPDADAKSDPDAKQATPEDPIEIEDTKAAEHEAEVQKLSESKKYFLPINAVEQRRSKQFVILGVVLSIVLALAWADIALDAALIKIPNVKPVTHLFSN